MNECPNCSVLRDELNAARKLLGEETSAMGYLEFVARIEFARPWIDTTGERLYVHCEQAWGESEAEFNERYKRVRERIGRVYRKALKGGPEPEAAPLPQRPNDLFTGRL